MYGPLDDESGLTVTPKIKLYMFSGSAPSLSAELMLDHKGLEYKRVHVMVGPHAFGMLGRGFHTMTVPALEIDGRRVQGSREISRELDRLVPTPPLFPTGPDRERAVREAERRGEELNDIARRVFWCAARRDPKVFHTVLRHPNPMMRPIQRVSRRLVTRLATAGHQATDRAAQDDLEALPAVLDQIDAWIGEGLIGGPELNAADFQVAPAVALLLRFADLAPLIEHRAVAQLARRLVPDHAGRTPTVIPSAWLESLRQAPPNRRPGASADGSRGQADEDTTVVEHYLAHP